MPTKGGRKRIRASRPGTALDLGHIFFIYKKKNQPGPGRQLLIEAKARANQQGGQGGVLLRQNFDEATRTDETLADMAGVSGT